MYNSSNSLFKVALMAALPIFLSAAVKVNADISATDTGTATSAVADVSPMTATLSLSLGELIAKSVRQSRDISLTFDRETDVNNRPSDQSGTDLSAASPSSNQSQYIQLTQTAGSELAAGEYQAAATDFGQAAAIYPGRTAAVLREGVALALAGEEDKAEKLLDKLLIIGDAQVCQDCEKTEEAIDAAKDGDPPILSTPEPVETAPIEAAPESAAVAAAMPAPAQILTAPAAAPVDGTPSAVDTLVWIVEKLNSLQDHYTAASYATRVAYSDDYKYGCVQTGLIEIHKNISRTAYSAPVITTNTVNLDVSDIVSVRTDPILYGPTAGATAITVTTSADDICVHQVIQDVGDPWNTQTNVDTTQQVSSCPVIVVPDDSLAQRIVKALQHIVDINAASGRHEPF